MNIHEIYVLNRALDGKDVFSLPSFAKMNIPEFMIDDIKDELIRKSILETQSTLTDEGVRLTSRLRMFKEAKKHLQIGYISIGLLNPNESILIVYNPLYKEYKIQVMDSTDMLNQLVSFYQFLLSDGTDEAIQQQDLYMNRNSFNKSFTLNEENHFRLVMQTESETADEIYFVFEEKYYVYDNKKGMLHSKSHKNLLRQIKERIHIDERNH